MDQFLDAARALIAQLPQPESRLRLFEDFAALGLPTASDEVWRYTPISNLNLDEYADPGASTAPTPALEAFADAICTIRMRDGQVVATDGAVDGLSIDVGDVIDAFGGREAAQRYGADAFGLLVGALSPHVLRVGAAAGRVISGVVVILHEVTSRRAFSTTRITVGEGASLDVVEVLVGGDGALVASLLEVDAAPGSRVRLSNFQRLAPTAWHISRSTARLDRDATVTQSVVGLGARFDRSRNDAELIGVGAHNELRTTYFGAGHQVHDFRTHQLHEAPRTTSALLSKGVVADESRSVYTGLIEIERGARRADARQSNHNLILSDHAHADTVPNLDIRENDVTCAHASTVGPLDEMQMWYLESRGVDAQSARRLLVQGFFREMTTEMPVALADVVNADVADALATLGEAL
jgi:Fe-S cluster assembly protein SufD